MTPEEKRAELREKIEAAEQRNKARSFGDYAREARDEATAFVKEHPLATVAGGLALGAVIAALVPGPGRRLRKKATKRGAVLAGVIAELGATYGSQFLESASRAARAGQDRLGDLGDTIGDTARHLGRDAGSVAGDASDSARSVGREIGRKATRTVRDLRSRMSH